MSRYWIMLLSLSCILFVGHRAYGWQQQDNSQDEAEQRLKEEIRQADLSKPAELQTPTVPKRELQFIAGNDSVKLPLFKADARLAQMKFAGRLSLTGEPLG